MKYIYNKIIKLTHGSTLNDTQYTIINITNNFTSNVTKTEIAIDKTLLCTHTIN